jgi:small multidrug resistance family-3 protein
VTVLRSLVLFALAALAEIGGAWLVWQGWREQRGLWWVAGGVFVAGSLGWAMVVDGFRPDRFDLTGAALCLLGVAVIMYAPRGGSA